MKHTGRMIYPLMLLMLLAMSLFVTANADTDTGSRIIVSLGDSYSAGEGIEPFFDQDMPEIEKELTSADWAAHRSKLAWSGQLKLNGILMSENRDTYWFFAAATGAKTSDLTNRQEIEIHRYTETTFSLDPQLDIFDCLPAGKKADYVTMTIGGNDAEFGNVVSAAVSSFRYLNPNGLREKVNAVWNEFYRTGGIADKLEKAYRDVAEKAGEQAEIIVAGYPQLFAPNGSLIVISKREAQYINKQVTEFNRQIRSIIEKRCKDLKNLHFVSVEEEFLNHGAYAIFPNEPYMNEIKVTQHEDHIWIKKLFTSEHDPTCLISAYSIHPNKYGAMAYARCVQKKIDKLEKLKLAADTNGVSRTNDEITATETSPGVYQYGDWKYKLLSDGTAEIIEYCGAQADDLVVPALLGDIRVTSITSLSNYGNGGKAIHITVSEGIINIQDKALSSAKVKRIILPNSLTYIGKEAFKYCASLEEVTFGNSLTTIDNSAFNMCRKLRSVSIPSSVTKIGERAFYECNALRGSVNLENVEYLGSEAFKNSQISEVTLSPKLTSIEDETFRDCKMLTSVRIPDKVTSIGRSAFSGCSSLTSVEIPDSVMYMGRWAFHACDLTSVTIPQNLAEIPVRAFSDNNNLTTVVIQEGTVIIGDYAFHCRKLTSVKIPRSVTSINFEAFLYNKAMVFDVEPGSYAEDYCKRMGYNYK